jgi:ribosomal protein S18 acetylase RimI-like enzyme
MEFREYRVTDSPRVLELCRLFETSPFAVDPRFRELSPRFEPVFATEMLQAASAFTLVAEEKGRVAGFATVGMNPAISGPARRKVGTILLLAVHRELRGRGIGSALASKGLAWLRSQGAELVTVGTDLTNLPAVAVYENLGFRLKSSWHIFRCYEPAEGISSGQSSFVDTARLSTLDPFLERFDRPVSLLRDSRVDTESVRAYLEDGFRRQLAKEETVSLQYFEAKRPVALVSAAKDLIAMRTLALERNIYRISDLIVLPGAASKKAGVELLLDLRRRLFDTALLEMWVPGDRADLVSDLSAAGFGLCYTGLSFHLALS